MASQKEQYIQGGINQCRIGL